MYICMRYKVSVTNHVDRRGNYSEKGCYLRNIGHIDQYPCISFHVHFTYLGQMCTYGKYEVSVIKPVVRRTVYRPWCHLFRCQTMTRGKNDTQQEIHDCVCSLAFMPNELKLLVILALYLCAYTQRHLGIHVLNIKFLWSKPCQLQWSNLCQQHTMDNMITYIFFLFYAKWAKNPVLLNTASWKRSFHLRIWN